MNLFNKKIQNSESNNTDSFDLLKEHTRPTTTYKDFKVSGRVLVYGQLFQLWTH